MSAADFDPSKGPRMAVTETPQGGAPTLDTSIPDIVGATLAAKAGGPSQTPTLQKKKISVIIGQFYKDHRNEILYGVCLTLIIAAHMSLGLVGLFVIGGIAGLVLFQIFIPGMFLMDIPLTGILAYCFKV